MDEGGIYGHTSVQWRAFNIVMMTNFLFVPFLLSVDYLQKTICNVIAYRSLIFNWKEIHLNKSVLHEFQQVEGGNVSPSR